MPDEAADAAPYTSADEQAEPAAERGADAATVECANALAERGADPGPAHESADADRKLPCRLQWGMRQALRKVRLWRGTVPDRKGDVQLFARFLDMQHVRAVSVRAVQSHGLLDGRHRRLHRRKRDAVRRWELVPRGRRPLSVPGGKVRQCPDRPDDGGRGMSRNLRGEQPSLRIRIRQGDDHAYLSPRRPDRKLPCRQW